MAFREFMGWQDAKLISIDDLHAMACTHTEHLSGLFLSEASTVVTTNHLPMDSISLIFAVLFLGPIATGEFAHARFYFAISTGTTEHFVGQPTLGLCLAYFLQHVFATCVETSNYAQSIIAKQSKPRTTSASLGAGGDCGTG